MGKPLDALTRELGTAPPEVIETLDPAQIEALTKAVASAREREREALETAIDSGLGFVPRLMRLPVKKVLFG